MTLHEIPLFLGPIGVILVLAAEATPSRFVLIVSVVSFLAGFITAFFLYGREG